MTDFTPSSDLPTTINTILNIAHASGKKGWHMVGNEIRRFAAARDGGVVLIFGMAAIPLMTVVGTAVDFSRGSATRAAMQAALDGTALNLVRDAGTLATGELAPRATALFTGVFNNSEARNVQVTAQYDPATLTLTLNGSADVATSFMGVVGIQTMQIGALSKARDADKLPCVIALDPNGSGTFKVSGTGTVNLPNCGLHVNSNSGNALHNAGTGWIKAKAISVVGGASGGNYSPAPTTSQKVLADPLSKIPEPAVPGPCTYTKHAFDANVTLPGGTVYCDNITFNANVTFGPGIHYFKDAQVKTASSITMTSQNAMLYFSNSNWDSSGAGKISFTPMLSGDYAGIAIFGSRSDTKQQTFKFTGNKDYFVAGTVYLPKQNLNLYGEASLSVTAKSGYVIAHQLSYEGGSTFTFDAFGGIVPPGFMLSTVSLVQ